MNPRPPIQSPTRRPRRSLVTRSLLIVTVFIGADRAGASQPERAVDMAGTSPLAATGTIEGRVLNPHTGQYVALVRITVDGTSLETFTDSAGQYRLVGVPIGEVRLTAFHTGGAGLAQPVHVLRDRTVTEDFSLTGFGLPAAPTSAAPVQLAEFIVSSSRGMEGAAIAIQEQRFAANMRSVGSTDEFGGVPDGNVGEFLRNFGGITIGFIGGNAREISIDGVPAANVPVTLGGFSLASAGQTVTSRTVAVDMISMNNLSRVEVDFSPTPESQGSALAGSVNLVPRSALERVRPLLQGSVFIMMRDQAIDFQRTPGPRREPTRKVVPGFDFTAVVPINHRLGYTLSAGRSTNLTGLDFLQNFWRGTALDTNGTTFPHTPFGQPYLSSFAVHDGSRFITRTSIGGTVDYRPTRNDRLTFTVSTATFDAQWMYHTLTFNVNRVLPGEFSPTWTHGAAGAGSVTLSNSGNYRMHRTTTPTLAWQHDGPGWKLEGGAGYSQATNHNRGIDYAGFRNSTATRTGVSVSFDDIFYLRPRRFTVTDGATGVAVDPYSIGSYAMTSVNDVQNDSEDIRRTFYASVRRDFHGAIPFTLKAGLDVRDAVRELGADRALPLGFVGGDHRASSMPAGGDDGATPFLDASYSQRTPPYGFPRVQWFSNEQLYDWFRANPSHFVLDANSQYRAAVATSKRAEERVSAAYLRGDLPLLHRRLKLTGGLRVEQTEVEAWGPLTDPTRNFQRDTQGRFILGADGRPAPVTNDALQRSRLTFIARGAHVEKEYLRCFPSLNASFALRDNVIARAAHSWSVGRPDFDQYTGGLTLPELGSAPGTDNRIQVNNVAIKAWSARTTNMRLEYYFQKVGQLAFTAFRRDYQDLFGGAVLRATPEFLAFYGLDPASYGAYDVTTQENLRGRVAVSGLSLNYRQALTFLPPWARGLQVFAQGTAQRATGATPGAFTGAFHVPRSGSWGISLTRERYNLRANWHYKGRHRRGTIAGFSVITPATSTTTGATPVSTATSSIEPGTYIWASKFLFIDVQAEASLSKRVALFANLRNIHDAPTDFETAGPSTPAHAQLRERESFGALWSFGFKATY